MIRKLAAFALLALAITCGVATNAHAAFPNGAFWTSPPPGNVPALFRPTAVHYFNGSAFVLRQATTQWQGWTPGPLPPPGSPGGPGPSFWARVTGIGTTEIGLGTFGVDSTKNELQLRCQTTNMVEPVGGSNSMLVSSSLIQCSVYTHVIGQTYWTGYAYGTSAPGGVVYSSVAASGVATGGWKVTVNLAAGGTFTAWIN